MHDPQTRSHVRRDPPQRAPVRSDPSLGLTRQEPMALDRADTYTDLYNLAPRGGDSSC